MRCGPTQLARPEDLSVYSERRSFGNVQRRPSARGGSVTAATGVLAGAPSDVADQEPARQVRGTRVVVTTQGCKGQDEARP